jgi:hypothetical protein
MSTLLCRWFGWFCPVPPVPPVPVARCALGCVAQRGSQSEIDGMAALGVKHARVTFFTAQDSPQYRATRTAMLLALDAKGIEPLIVVHDFPTAAEIPSTMADLTTAFPGRLWQIGNEYDAQPWREQNAGWGPKSTAGAFYALIMRAVVAACPGQRFVGMGLATTASGDAARWQAFAWSYFAAAGPTMEAWCIHAYANVPAQVADMQVALLHRWPLWVTEYNAVPIPAFAAVGVSRAYWYCYWSGSGPAGLVNADDSHRASWDALHGVCL